MGRSFSELIKNFDKTRDYIRDFYIYGFKTRSDFQYKSLRTYDDERRRIESWLGDHIKFFSGGKGKQISISCDTGSLSENPLYAAYRSRSFTSNDIQLHFFILDILSDGEFLSLDQITDKMLDDYGVIFEPQTVRLKLKEYIREGIIVSKKCGRSLVYARSPDTFDNIFSDSAERIADMIKFFSEASPFGVVGNHILRALGKVNDLFLIKHNFIVHTLEDNVLLQLTEAMEEKRSVTITIFGKSHAECEFAGVPMRILVSTQTGRRYVVMRVSKNKRFMSFRLDSIRHVWCGEICEAYDKFYEKYIRNAPLCWGASFGVKRPQNGAESLKMTIYADEKEEAFIIERLKREGRGGTVTKTAENVFVYERGFFDVSEAVPWIKTFTGRIIALESSDPNIVYRFYRDIERMKNMYSDKKG